MNPEEPKPIGGAIEAVFARMSQLPATPEVEPTGPQIAEILKQLEDRGYPERHREKVQTMAGPSLEKARELWPLVRGGDCLLLLVGDRGPGKTQMATKWAFERGKAGLSVGWYRKTADLIAEIKRTWSDSGRAVGTEDDVLRKYRKAPYLVLDEFDERGASDWESRTLNNIVDHRYDAMLATVLIANVKEAELQKRVSASIVSRATETGGLVVCDWPSYREKK